MPKGRGLIRTLVEQTVECSRCEMEATATGCTLVESSRYFRTKGWKIRKNLWVCPSCLKKENAGPKGDVARKVAEAADKAADVLRKEARKEKDKSMREVARKDAVDFDCIADLARDGDLKGAARHYRDMDTAARDRLECDDEVLNALGFERIDKRRI